MGWYLYLVVEYDYSIVVLLNTSLLRNDGVIAIL